MAISVDRAAIKARRAWMRVVPSPALDLTVMVPGMDRWAATQTITETLNGRFSIGVIEPLPIRGGTWIYLQDAGQWEAVVDALATRFADDGGEGLVVSSPPMIHQDAPVPVVPGALMGFTMDPPVEAGPWLPSGWPQPRISIPADAIDRLADHAARWTAHAGETGDIWLGGWGPFIPATSDDLAHNLRRLLADPRRTTITVRFLGHQRLGRQTQFLDGGQVGYVDLDPGSSPLEKAADLTQVLTDHATHLDIGFVRLVQGASTDLNSLRGMATARSRWCRHRHLWSSRVLDAHGIQLITTAHLDHAHDLSSWRIDEVAPDRWLVQAHDLAPWYDPADFDTWHRDPPPDVLQAARADFGDMILTDQIAAAHPPPSAPSAP